MNPKENYLHEFFRIFFANKQWVKRVFLIFAMIALVLPLMLKQSFDITAQVIVQSKALPGRRHHVAEPGKRHLHPAVPGGHGNREQYPALAGADPADHQCPARTG